MSDEHAAAKADREYGELYYSADAVCAILRTVAGLLEGDERTFVLRLSHTIPSTMPWNDAGADVQLSTGFGALCRRVQLGVHNDAVLAGCPVRLDALLWRGASDHRSLDGQHPAGMADEQLDAPP